MALVKVIQGVMTVIDTAGDNNLGGKDLDLAMIDKLIIPYLDENYSIKSFLKDPLKKEILRIAMKGYAEDAKVQLSDNPTYDISTFPGEIRATDDDGTEFNLNMTIRVVTKWGTVGKKKLCEDIGDTIINLLRDDRGASKIDGIDKVLLVTAQSIAETTINNIAFSKIIILNFIKNG